MTSQKTNDDVVDLEEKILWQGKQLTSANMEARKLREENSRLKETVVRLSMMVTGIQFEDKE